MEMFVSILVKAISVRGMIWFIRPFWTEKQGKCSQIVSCICCVLRMAKMLRCRDGQSAKSLSQVGWRWGDKTESCFYQKNMYFGRVGFFFFLIRGYRDNLKWWPATSRPFPVKCISLTLVSDFSTLWSHIDILKYSN